MKEVLLVVSQVAKKNIFFLMIALITKHLMTYQSVIFDKLALITKYLEQIFLLAGSRVTYLTGFFIVWKIPIQATGVPRGLFLIHAPKKSFPRKLSRFLLD